MDSIIDLYPLIENGRVVYAACPRQVAPGRSPIPGLLILALLVALLPLGDHL